MKNLYKLLVFCLMALPVANASAQRQSEKLGRGLVAVNQGGGKVYLGWRLLGTDPDGIAFNLYRSVNGGDFAKLNASALTATTDYVDYAAAATSVNAYYVVPVVNGVEQTPGATVTVPANAAAQQYQRIAVQPIDGAYDYDLKFGWVGDLDGDGEFDYVIDRLPMDAYPGVKGGRTAKVEAYLNNGTFKWRVDAGPNVSISNGHNDMVTVFDLDGDGRSEVILKTSEGTVFGDGTVIGDVNADGVTDYRNASGDVVGNAPQYISVIDGATGAELARAAMPHVNELSPSPNKKFWEIGPFDGHFGIAYLDGIRPSFLFQYTNRNSGGTYDKSFNQFVTTWDYANGQLTQRTDWADLPNMGHEGYSHFHQIRIVDVDRDGKDEMVEGGFVLDDNGSPLWGNAEIVHGDRHQTADIDPDRPGLETFLIQQNNPSSLGMALIDAATGQFLKKWYMGAQGDVGRGEALDMDANSKGLELVSTMGGLYSAKGEFLGEKSIFPNSGIWWDADLTREMLRAPDGSGFNIMVNKPGWNGSQYTEGARLIEFAKESGWLVKASYGCRPMFCGDIMGDWREELMVKERNSDNTGNVAFRIYTTTIPSQSRIYCLMQNPAYRQTATTKGYYQADYTDYYLGAGMATPPVPPIQEAKLVWTGGLNGNAWDLSTANWLQSGTASLFGTGDDVMFDLRGAVNPSVAINEAIAPSRILVNSPTSFTFGGSGSITGSGSLIKSGPGNLVLNNNNDFSGTTIVSEGTLYVNGTLPNSVVAVRWKAGLGGAGTIGRDVAFAKGAVIVPATEGVPGTLTFLGNVSLPGETVCRFDLSDEPTGTTKAHDKIVINGNLTLTGVNTIQINQLNGNLPAGTYPLVQYAGSFTGDIANLKIAGIVGKKYTVTNVSGLISVTVEDTRDPAKVTWSGAGKTWDILQSSNWLLNGQPDLFAPNDSVIFNSVGSAQASVTIAAGSMPIKDMVVETASTNYQFSGTGIIGGEGGITKNGAGTLSLYTKNDYTGKTVINGGRLNVGYMDDAGLASAIGATTSLDPSYFVLNNAYLRYAGAAGIYTNRGITLNGTADTIDVVNAKMLTLKGLVSGTGALVKKGIGTVTLQQQNNTFAGGVVLKEGYINLGDDQANQFGMGPQATTVTIENGTLATFSNSSSYTKMYWNIVVPNGANATIKADARGEMYGKLTGSGTLNVSIPYVRSDFYGDWSGFTGKINIKFHSEGKGTTSGVFRIYNNYGYGKAAVNLSQAENSMGSEGSARTVSVGELSGVAGSSIYNSAWIVGGLNTDATFAGKIKGNSLTKVGTGTWTLTDTCFYTANTAVSGGMLNVVAPSLISGPVTVSANAAIGGTGKIGGAVTVQSQGTVAPGNGGIGKLTLVGNLSMAAGSFADIQINKTAGTCDQIFAGGTMALNGTLRISKTDVSPFVAGNTYKLFDAASITGGFTAIEPATPGVGLIWNTSALLTSGTLSVDALNGMGRNDLGGTAVYPNPTSGMLNVVCPGIGAAVAVKVESLSGQTLLQMDNGDAKTAQVDLSALPGGVYLVKVYVDHRCYVHKVVRE